MDGAYPLIDPPFRGTRTYLFAADILEAALGLTGADRDITLQLKVPSDCALDLVPGFPPEPAPDLCGTFRHGDRDGLRRYWLRRRADRPIVERIDGPDDEVERCATFGTGTARLPAGVPGPLAVRALILAVLLLGRERPDDTWRLAEWTADRPPPADGVLQATVRNRIAGRFWKVELAIDGAVWGHVILARVID